jgi:hypothetical protein
MTRKDIHLPVFALLLLTGCGAGSAPGTARQDAAPAPSPAASPAASPGFETTLEWQGIAFRVSSPNDSSLSTLSILPSGLAGSNEAIMGEVDGTVVGADIGDLDANGSPEVYVFVRSAGSGSYGSLVAYAVNDGKSLSEISLPDLADDPKLAQGYMGHDEFAVIENSLARRFPVYSAGDTNAAPTGKTRQLQYKLAAGEAGWVLRPEGSSDF